MVNKSQRKQIREEKKKAARHREKITGLLFKSAAAILCVLAIYVFYQGLFSRPPVYPPEVVGAGDHVQGNPDAPVTITIYADFQCPACLTETQLISRAWPKIRDSVQLVFRHYPLDTHRFAFLAARYAEAAGAQGKFWEMHDLLYSNQDAWSELDDVQQIFDSYAQRLGLDMDKLTTDLQSDQVRNKIITDQKGGNRAGVRSTPTMFINGHMIESPRTSTELIDMVNEARAGGR